MIICKLQRASPGKALLIALCQKPSVIATEGFGAFESAFERGAREVTVSRAGNVLVPDATQGVIEANSLEAVVKADGPAKFASARGENGFGQVEKAGKLRGVIHHSIATTL